MANMIVSYCKMTRSVVNRTSVDAIYFDFSKSFGKMRYGHDKALKILLHFQAPRVISNNTMSKFQPFTGSVVLKSQ